MDKLKGSGSTFSTSGQRWMPFRFNAKLAARNARLHKLKRKGITPATDKASLRQAAEEASQARQPTIIEPGKRTRPPDNVLD